MDLCFFFPPPPQCILEIQVGRGQVYTGTDHVHISLSIPVNHTGKKKENKKSNLELWIDVGCCYLLHWLTRCSCSRRNTKDTCLPSREQTRKATHASEGCLSEMLPRIGRDISRIEGQIFALLLFLKYSK